MVRIDVKGFADKIKEYHEDPQKPDKWFYPPITKFTVDDDSVESRLCIPFEERKIFDGEPYSSVNRRGITFDYTMQLAMQLIERAYNRLTDGSYIQDYAKAVAKAMQRFARPFPKDEVTMCYPHFLLHGIAQPTLEEVADKINTSGRIIHETLSAGDKLREDYGVVKFNGNLRLSMSGGCVDDYFGIAYLLAKQDAVLLSSAASYIAKVSFFVDTTNKEIYVITVKGSKFKDTNQEKEHDRIASGLGMGTRRFLLEKLKQFGKKKGFKKIKVVKPQEHPMFIEGHKGFLGTYEPVIRKAGITEDNGCYLESRL